MPISQTTILEAYGHLCDLADLGEKLEGLIRQPDMLKKRTALKIEIAQLTMELAQAVQHRQKLALQLILRDEPTIKANPLTGRLR